MERKGISEVNGRHSRIEYANAVFYHCMEDRNVCCAGGKHMLVSLVKEMKAGVVYIMFPLEKVSM